MSVTPQENTDYSKIQENNVIDLYVVADYLLENIHHILQESATTYKSITLFSWIFESSVFSCSVILIFANHLQELDIFSVFSCTIRLA